LGYKLNGGDRNKLLISEETIPVARSSSKRKGANSREESKSGSGTSIHRKFQIFGLANPRSGDGLASGFLTDYPVVNEKHIYLEEISQTVQVELRFFNVLEA